MDTRSAQRQCDKISLEWFQRRTTATGVTAATPPHAQMLSIGNPSQNIRVIDTRRRRRGHQSRADKQGANIRLCTPPRDLPTNQHPPAPVKRLRDTNNRSDTGRVGTCCTAYRSPSPLRIACPVDTGSIERRRHYCTDRLGSWCIQADLHQHRTVPRHSPRIERYSPHQPLCGSVP